MTFPQDQARIPSQSDRVWKDECAYSFASQETPGGLFVDMRTFIGYGRNFALKNFQKTNQSLYLNLKKIKITKEREEDRSPPQKITKLAIGVEGGLPLEEIEYKQEAEVVILPQFESFPLTSPQLPEKIKKAAEGILAADSVSRKEEVSFWEDKREISACALDLYQIPNPPQIPPKGNKCIHCDMTENLWMNLTDGVILCGRRQPDGSGGNGHAERHFKETSYPLVVKLGTINAEGADVYSYPEDNMVMDPYLNLHLKHFGINAASLEKYDKTMAEMTLDHNLKFDYARLQADGKTLTPAYGPGFTGIKNLGNSCYLSSIVQVLFAIPDFEKRYRTSDDQLFNASPADPTTHFDTQMSKVANGLLSGDYSFPESEGIAPRMFKTLIGKNHREFSTNRQQDALEFFQYLLELISRQHVLQHSEKNDAALAFQLTAEERIECQSSGAVKYTNRKDNFLSVPIPLELASNKDEVDNYHKKQKHAEAKGEKLADEVVVRPRVSLLQCIQAYAAPEIISDFYSDAVKTKTTAKKTTRLATFPEVLTIQLRKFYLDNHWNPKKLDVFVDVTETLDLEWLRGKGLLPSETPLPEPSSSTAAVSAPQPQANPEIVAALMSMGFSELRSKKAALKTGNSGTEQAVAWVFEHNEDPDIDDPLPLPVSSPTPSSSSKKEEVSEEGLQLLMGMGFDKKKATRALKETNNNIERATDWIFNHMDDIDVDEPSASSSTPSAAPSLPDGPAKYELFAMVSHMGSSTACGHYVVHIKKNGKWYLFNDNKVALSEDTPLDMGYLYFYRRS